MCAVPAGFTALPLSISQLSLAAVLKCGQSFRWSIYPLSLGLSATLQPTCPSHEYRLCLRDRVICLRQTSDTLFYRAVFPEDATDEDEETARCQETMSWIRDYFQLDIDLERLYDDWAARDKVFKGVKERFSGIRMLRQDPWENLVSFICSSNNNISRITGMVKSLCKHFSSPLVKLSQPNEFEHCTAQPLSPPADREPTQPRLSETDAYHPFPHPSVLAAPSVSALLRSLGFGYRADFIQRTAKMLVDAHGGSETNILGQEASEKWLMTLRDFETIKAREELLQFVGVGRKVADCVLLMSLDKREVVPVDTHVHQIAIKHYGLRGPSGSKAKVNMTPKLYEDVNAKLAAVWGSHAGWAHSVLFTSDLKAFSSYGLPTPSPTPSKRVLEPSDLIDSPLSTSSVSVSKRKRVSVRARASTFEVEGAVPGITVAHELLATEELITEVSTMAERVKRRRRGPGSTAG